MKETLEQIKAECRKVLELSEKATPGPWKNSNFEIVQDLEIPWLVAKFASPADRSFISYSRTFTPSAAQMMLTMIESLERDCEHPNFSPASCDCLQALCEQWEERR